MKNTLNFKTPRLAALAVDAERHNKRALFTRLVCSMNDWCPAVARTHTGPTYFGVGVPFPSFCRSHIHSDRTAVTVKTPNARSVCHISRTASRFGKRRGWRPSARKICPNGQRFSYGKIDRNRNDARHVIRPGQWGRCILIHRPVPPAGPVVFGH